MTHGRAGMCALACSLALWLALPAHGRCQHARASAELQYEAVDAVRCPDQQAFRDIVAGRLGYDPFQTGAERVIEARIVREGPSFVGHMRVHGANGQLLGARDLEAPAQDCAEIATAMAIAISIVLDPLGAAAAPEPAADEPVPLAHEPSEPAAAPAPAAPVTLAPPPRKAPRAIALITRASLAVDGGLAPGLTLGPVLSLGLGFGHLSVLVDGRVDLMPRTATVSSGDRLEAALFTAGPGLCVSYGVGLGCAGLELGAFQGRGVDVQDPRTQTSFFAAFQARAGVRVPLGKTLSFHALGELRTPLVRTSLSIENSTVWNAPPIGFGGLVGLGATFL